MIQQFCICFLSNLYDLHALVLELHVYDFILHMLHRKHLIICMFICKMQLLCHIKGSYRNLQCHTSDLPKTWRKDTVLRGGGTSILFLVKVILLISIRPFGTALLPLHKWALDLLVCSSKSS